MRAMTEIEWLGGRVTKVPELAMGEPPDLDRVFCILYEGQPRVCRVAGGLGPRVGGERGRCVGIRDGGGFRKRLRRGEPRWRGLFVMLDIASQHGSTDHLRDGPTG